MSVPVFSIDNLPLDFEAPGSNAWGVFQLRTPLRAIKIDGPFEVALQPEHQFAEVTPTLSCSSGWLAIDEKGLPFAIPDDEFKAIYRPYGS